LYSNSALVPVAFTNIESLVGSISSDAFTLGAAGSIGRIDGGAGADTLIGANLNGTWSITAANAGTLANSSGSRPFTNIETLVGGTAADTFTHSGTATVGFVNGGAGTDTLTGANLASTWSLLSLNAGTLAGSSAASELFTEIESLVGNAGSD